MSKKSLAIVAISLCLGGVWPAEAAVAKKTVTPGEALFNILEKAKAYNYDFVFSNQLQSKVGKKVNEGAKIEVKMSGVQTSPDKSLVSIKANFDGSKLKNKSPFGNKLSAQVDLAESGQTAYLKVKDYPAILGTFLNLESLKNQWIKINPADFKKIADGLGMDNFERKSFERMIKNSQNEKSIKEQVKAMRKSGAGKITKRLANAYYEKNLVKRWEFSLDKKKWLNLQAEIYKLNGTPLSAEQLKSMKEDLADISFGKGELAINSRGDYVKVKIPFTVSDKNGNETKITKSNLEMTIRNINSKKIKLEIPKKTINLKQAQNSLLESN